MNAPITRIALSRGLQDNPVQIKGEGAPVVFLHGLLGPEWSECLDTLSGTRRVIAPAHAGSDEPDELRQFEGIYDLVIYYDDLFNRLGLEKIDLIGHSFGGMVAAEYAAAYPHRVGKLVLIDALGLWRDDVPVEDYLLIPAARQVELLLGDPDRADIKARLALPDDPQARVATLLSRITALASASHFIWPIPERGLRKRLHRLAASTLILWGANDRFIPKIYAEEFASRIAASKVVVLPDAGHAPHLDQPAVVASLIAEFLGAA